MTIDNITEHRLYDMKDSLSESFRDWFPGDYKLSSFSTNNIKDFYTLKKEYGQRIAPAPGDNRSVITRVMDFFRGFFNKYKDPCDGYKDLKSKLKTPSFDVNKWINGQSQLKKYKSDGSSTLVSYKNKDLLNLSDVVNHLNATFFNDNSEVKKSGPFSFVKGGGSLVKYGWQCDNNPDKKFKDMYCQAYKLANQTLEVRKYFNDTQNIDKYAKMCSDKLSKDAQQPQSRK